MDHGLIGRAALSPVTFQTSRVLVSTGTAPRTSAVITLRLPCAPTVDNKKYCFTCGCRYPLRLAWLSVPERTYPLKLMHLSNPTPAPCSCILPTSPPTYFTQVGYISSITLKAFYAPLYNYMYLRSMLSKYLLSVERKKKDKYLHVDSGNEPTNPRLSSSEAPPPSTDLQFFLHIPTICYREVIMNVHVGGYIGIDGSPSPLDIDRLEKYLLLRRLSVHCPTN